MKNKRRVFRSVLVVFLIGIMTFAMTACNKGGGASGSKNIEEILKATQKNMQETESMTYDMVQEMGMKVMGMEMNMVMDLKVEQINSPMALKLEGHADVGALGSYDITMYMEEEGDGVVLYSGMDFGDGEMFWMKQKEEINSAAVSQYSADASLEMYMDSASNFKEAGTEDVNGTKATKFEGTITGDAISKVVSSAGVGEQVGLDLEEYADLFKDSGDIQVIFWIDTDKEVLVKYQIDMSEVLNNMMTKLAEHEAEMEDVTVEISKMISTATVTGMNNVSEIVIPEEAKNGEDVGEMMIEG